MLAESVLQSLRGGNGVNQPTPPRDPALREAIREAWDASKRDDFDAYEEALNNIIQIKLAVTDR